MTERRSLLSLCASCVSKNGVSNSEDYSLLLGAQFVLETTTGTDARKELPEPWLTMDRSVVVILAPGPVAF